jgi:hypothetical protein
MRENGWVPVRAQEQSIRTEARRGFQKHVVRFARVEHLQSLLVYLLNTCGQLDLLLRSQQRGLADLSKVNLNTLLRIDSHAPTSPQIGSEATAGSVEEHQLISDAIRKA